MNALSRRQFLYASALWSFSSPLSKALASSREDGPGKDDRLPITTAVLKAAYISERMAHRHYVHYCRKAVAERYPNIAYFFRALAISEKIHGDNYKRILTALMKKLEEPQLEIVVGDTKANLGSAAEKELLKIRKIYPGFLARLQMESHDEAVIHCMYSWKSHRQHEQKINELRKYWRLFFGAVASRIEGLKLDFHVCDVCGSTVDEKPETPCEICNYPASHYRKVARPA
ncbi:MAG: ferritin family protein [Thermodesulfobacteriota bacterium]|nr:ferritin family protein [Thermodesulfobacteriota bacterium]